MIEGSRRAKILLSGGIQVNIKNAFYFSSARRNLIVF
jgi:hypothetical protein